MPLRTGMEMGRVWAHLLLGDIVEGARCDVIVRGTR